MSELSQIGREIAELPPALRIAVLDFVQFLKHQHGLAPAPVSLALPEYSGDSNLFLALERAGFVGCIGTDVT